MEAANRLLSPHLWASYAYLSLGFGFHRDSVALEGTGHSPKPAEQKPEGASVS